MEGLLSIRDRKCPHPQRKLVSSKVGIVNRSIYISVVNMTVFVFIQSDLQIFADKQNYPYQSCDPFSFQSSFGDGVMDEMSCSAKK